MGHDDDASRRRWRKKALATFAMYTVHCEIGGRHGAGRKPTTESGVKALFQCVHGMASNQVHTRGSRSARTYYTPQCFLLQQSSAECGELNLRWPMPFPLRRHVGWLDRARNWLDRPVVIMTSDDHWRRINTGKQVLFAPLRDKSTTDHRWQRCADAGREHR